MCDILSYVPGTTKQAIVGSYQVYYSSISTYIRNAVVVLAVGSSQVGIVPTHDGALPSKNYGFKLLYDGGTSTGKNGAGTNGNN